MKFSSRGDYDEAGRVKPDILAPGADITSSTTGSDYKSASGTSLAAPHVSAVAAQILKQYPSASPALVKAFIISNAVGGGTTNAKDIDEVWGRLDAFYSIYKLGDEYVDSYDENVVGNILSGQPTERYYTIDVPSGAEKLIVTMVYSDDPADAGASSTLVNDLDLFLKKPDGTSLYQSDDDINNVEKYVISNPVAGTWEAHVKTIELADLGGVISKTQDYAISIRVIKSTESPYISVYTYSTKSTVTEGETFDVYANVYSLGLGSYDTWAEINTPAGLTLLSGDVDGTEAEYDVLGDIPHNSNRQTKHWQFRADTAGTYTITVTAKGRGIDDTGFLSSDSVEVVGNPPVTPLPDLTLTSSDIAWDSASSQITATIHNTGDADASNVFVEFFNGDPANNDLIGSQTITSITAGGNQDAVVTWNNAPEGTQTVYVVIDSAHLGSGAILESNETNNIASKSVSVPTKTTYVSAITLTPEQPDIQSTTTITTTITNSGGTINNARLKVLWAGPDREFDILEQCTVDFSISSGESNIEKSCNWDFDEHTGQIFIKAELWNWDTFVLVSALEKETYVLDRAYELKVWPQNTINPTSDYLTMCWQKKPGQASLISGAYYHLHGKLASRDGSLPSSGYVMQDYGNWSWLGSAVFPTSTPEGTNCLRVSRTKFDYLPDGMYYFGVLEDVDTDGEMESGDRDGISSQSYYLNFHNLAPAIDSPADNSEVSGVITVEASSKTNGIKDEDITEMVFQKYEGGSWTDLYTDNTPENGFSYTEDVTNVPDLTEKVIRSEAFAMDGSSATSSSITVIVRSDIKPDMVVYPSSISFNPSQPSEGDVVTIYAQVFNIGSATANDVKVRFYLGDPDAGGTQIGSEQTITSIDVSDNGVASVNWNSIGGSHDIYVVADRLDQIPESDESNNKASKTIKVNVPPTTPTSLTPTSGIYGGTSPISIACSGSTDSNGDTIYYNILGYYDGSWHDLELDGDGAYNWDVSSIASQANVNLQCNATDSTDSSAYFNPAGTLEIDNTPPTGTITINDGAAYTNSPSVTLTLSCSDTSGCSEMQFSNDGTSYTDPEAYATTKAWNLTAGDGTKTAYVKYKDGAGNWMTTPAMDTIVLDTTPPTITLSSPSDGSWTNDNTPAFQFTATDNLDALLSCELFVDGVGYGSASAPNNTLTTITANASLSDGARSWWVTCTDDGPNTGQSAAWTLNIDTTLASYNQADIYATMFDRNLDQGDTMSSRVYVENMGQAAIDDFLRIAIADPYGEKVYKKLKPMYIEPGDMETFRISWTIPSNAPEGLYKLKIEFDDWDIDVLPAVRWFDVGTVSVDTDPPIITVDSPPNTTISDATPDLNLTTDEPAAITYNWDSAGNISGCRNCTVFNTTYGESNGSNPNTVLLMHMNENYSTTTYGDASNSDGTISDATWAAGRFGPALDFYADGPNAGDYVNVPYSQSMNFNKSDSFTVAAWIKYEAVPVTYNSYILDKYQNDTGYHILLKKNNGSLWFMYHTDARGDLGVSSTTPVNDSEWHYVVGVRDAAAGRGYVYVDGSLEGNESDPTAGGDGSGTNNEDLTIGTFSPTYGFFNGTIDEVVIYNRSLSQSEIQGLYNKTLSAEQHSVSIWATDAAGNENSTTRWFDVD